MSVQEAIQRQAAAIHTRGRFSTEEVHELGAALVGLAADCLALFVKTKSFHWHASGPHFRDYHVLLDEQADQILAMLDPLAERARKIGAPAIHSIGQAARSARVLDNDADYVTPADMLAELGDDNRALAGRMLAVHALCQSSGDVATTSLIETFLDQTEGRVWFLFETGRSRGEA